MFKITVFFCLIFGFLACQTILEPAGNSTLLAENFYTKSYHPNVNAYSYVGKEGELDSMVVDFIRQWAIEGASMCLLKDGNVLYAKGYGWADKEKGIAMQPYHRLRIASVSKLFTAVAIMKLVEQGKLSLDSKVFGEKGILKSYRYLPIADTLAYQITVEHLLTHSAGWRNQLRTDPMFAPVAVAKAMKLETAPNFETTLRFMLSQRGMFRPGEFVDYSNFGYTLLGEVVRDVAGKPFEKFLQEDILKPMGVERIAIGKNTYEERLPHETRYYTHPKESRKLSIYNFSDSASAVYEGNNTQALAGAGGLIASPLDIAQFVLHIDGLPPVADILSPATLQRMTTTVSEDSTKQRLIGWKHADAEKWWRTGNLSSTSSSVTCRRDGYTWVFVTNTGSWRGPFFVYEIEGLMRRFLRKYNALQVE
jgi:CubicO group peptidase (beta-lactamase class C family)